MTRAAIQRVPVEQFLGWMRYDTEAPGYVNGSGTFTRPPTGQVIWSGPVDPSDSNPDDFIAGVDLWIETAAPGQTLFITDLSQYTTGVVPSDWTKRFSTGATWTTEDVSGLLIRNAAGSATRRALSWDELTDLSDCEILTRIKTNVAVGTASTLAAVCGVMIRGSGGSGTETGYAILLSSQNSSPKIRLSEYNGGTLTPLTDVVTSHNPQVWNWLRVNASGTSLTAKIWADGASEPGSPQLTGTISAITAAGWTGLFSFIEGTHDWNYFAVDILGQTIPVP